MQRTLKLKISAPADFLQFLETCNVIFNRYVKWCFENNSYNKNKAHKELYVKFVQEYPDVPTGLLQTIRDNALESVKALKFKFKPVKKPWSMVRYDKRTVSLRGNQLSFSCAGKRFKQEIVIPEFFKKYAAWSFQAATIGYDKLKKCFKANLVFQSDTPEKQGDRAAVGIDRGLYNIVSLSDGFKYASNQIRKVKREVLFLKKQIQTKGTQSAKRKLKSLSGYEKRFSLNENHKISNKLVNMPYDIFVLEDLRGIRKQKSKGKILNKWISNWSFWQLEQLLTYKAEAFGKQVVKVDARYTSQKCSNCGNIEKKNRNGSHYACDRCGYREHADINAAKNIRNNLILTAAKPKVRQAVVNQPNAIETIGFELASHHPCGDGN